MYVFGQAYRKKSLHGVLEGSDQQREAGNFGPTDWCDRHFKSALYS